MIRNDTGQWLIRMVGNGMVAKDTTPTEAEDLLTATTQQPAGGGAADEEEPEPPAPFEFLG